MVRYRILNIINISFQSQYITSSSSDTVCSATVIGSVIAPADAAAATAAAAAAALLFDVFGFMIRRFSHLCVRHCDAVIRTLREK